MRFEKRDELRFDVQSDAEIEVPMHTVEHREHRLELRVVSRMYPIVANLVATLGSDVDRV